MKCAKCMKEPQKELRLINGLCRDCHNKLKHIHLLGPNDKLPYEIVKGVLRE